MSAIPASSSMNGRISFGPSAQLIPMLSSWLCETEFQYASTVWPESVRPLRSVMVNETITGTRRPGFLEVLVDRKQRRLRVQRIEDRFDQQQVHAAVQQPARLLAIGLDQLIEGDGAISRDCAHRAKARPSCWSARGRRPQNRRGPVAPP